MAKDQEHEQVVECVVLFDAISYRDEVGDRHSVRGKGTAVSLRRSEFERLSALGAVEKASVAAKREAAAAAAEPEPEPEPEPDTGALEVA